MSRGVGWIAITAVVCGAAGFLAGLTVAAREDLESALSTPTGGNGATPENAARATGAAEPMQAARAPRSADKTGRTADAATPADGGAAALLRERLGRDPPPGREEEAERLAAKIRADSAARSRWADREAVEAVRASILKDAELAADAARGGTIAVLRNLASSGGTMLDTAGSSEAMAKHFQRSSTGPEIAAADLKSDTPLTNGTTVRFGPGFHRMAVSRIGTGATAFPEDLVVVGDGMDRTIVRFDEFSARSVVRNMTFRDMTIDCGDDYLFDLRNEPATIRMERCRIIRFDMGAGGSVMLAAPSAAFFASDCRFEAGFGRSPGSGNLFRATELIARLERCAIVGPFSSVFERGPANTTVFAQCEFRRMPADFEGLLTTPPGGVRFDACTVADPLAAGDRGVARTDPSFLLAIAAAGGANGLRELTAFPAAFRALPTDFDFEPMFAEPQDAVVVDGSSPAESDGRHAAVVARFSSGAFDAQLPATEGTLVVSGAGMDSTLLRLRGSPRAKLVIYRDLSIDASYASAVSSSTPLVAFSRCRLVAFDSGAGGSTALDHRGTGVIWLSDCRIDAGYGRSPGSGTAFGLSSTVAVRADRTTIALGGDELCRSGLPTLKLVNSRVIGAKPGTVAGAQHWISAWPGTTVEEVPAGFTPPREPRPLTDINPSWKK